MNVTPAKAIHILKDKGFKTAILTGGITLNSEFARLSLIDEVLLNVEGVFIGKGIPLFNPQQFQLDLKLNSIERFEENGVTLKYQVVK